MTTPIERHNKIAREFVMKFGREIETSAELMVVIESIIFGSMRLMQSLHGLSASASAEMVESAIHRATERFAKGQDQ
jgi:hypothetical protein